ncbi:MAG: hypothetical protein AABW50_02600 [Nanoarchaeota archaeon]
MDDGSTKTNERVKLLEKLVVSEEFIVGEVRTETFEKGGYLKTSSIGESESYYSKTSHISTTLLEVRHKRVNGNPVRKLIFHGFSSVEPGDSILARIPKCSPQEFYDTVKVCSKDQHACDIVTLDVAKGMVDEYTKRIFSEEECSIEIVKKLKKGNRIERSTDYESYNLKNF